MNHEKLLGAYVDFENHNQVASTTLVVVFGSLTVNGYLRVNCHNHT